MTLFRTWFSVPADHQNRLTTDAEIKAFIVRRLRESADWLEGTTLTHEGNNVFTGMGSPLGYFDDEA